MPPRRTPPEKDRHAGTPSPLGTPLAAALGSASVTSVYFSSLRGGQLHALAVSPTVCLCLVPLLPRVAAAIEH
jgi:hypothetical protein